jgi:hypothetical protein
VGVVSDRLAGCGARRLVVLVLLVALPGLRETADLSLTGAAVPDRWLLLAPPALVTWPLAVFPTFMVPFFAILHLVAVLQSRHSPDAHRRLATHRTA